MEPDSRGILDSAEGEVTTDDCAPEDAVHDTLQGADDGDELEENSLRTVVEWIAVIVSAFAVALLIKAFVFQAFEIPSGSMESTVNIGDRILVNKLSYRWGDVERGDLVVFRRDEDAPGDTDDLIKRAIGLPGETVEVRDDGRIWIWGPGEEPADARRLDEPYLDEANELLPSPSATVSVTSDLWNRDCVNGDAREPGRCTLDEDTYFMMGDNRFDSSDSRAFGPVVKDDIVGRAFARIWPLSDISGL